MLNYTNLQIYYKRTTISNDTLIPFNFLEPVAYILSARCTLHRHVDCGKPLFSVCVPTPDINYHRNIKVVFEVLISDFFTLRSEHEMLRKVPKIKDFYEFFFCINTIVSTCFTNGNISTATPLSIRYPFPHRYFISRASVSGLQETYTTFFGAILTSADRNFSLLPVRGGSRSTTSAFSPASVISSINSPASP